VIATFFEVAADQSLRFGRTLSVGSDRLLSIAIAAGYDPACRMSFDDHFHCDIS
jgi:hypothetical protein